MTEEQIKIIIGNIIYESMLKFGIDKMDQVSEIVYAELKSKDLI
jgi:hypothetical protein